MKDVITRFPPSPTGFLHIGRARTALFNYLFTKSQKGTMIFRIEDTDTERSKKEYEQNIIDCLGWLGITYDHGPIRQSERSKLYTSYLRKLIENGHAYISKEPAEKDPKVMVEVVRYKNPNKKITFTDLIRGEIEFDTTDLNDFVIARSVSEPLYHLAVVVDDHEMGVTHIIRGEDGISNTPRQILIQEGIGAKRPLYAHIPLILAPDKSKLSGRHGAVAVTEYREKGYLPEAILNYLALLGWNPGTPQELFSVDELINTFDLSKVQKGGAVFDLEKLKWFNREYIRKLGDDSFASHAAAFVPEWIATSSPLFKRTIPLLREKISTFDEIPKLFGSEGELGFIHVLRDYKAESLPWKKEPDREAARTHLQKIQELVSSVADHSFTTDAIKNAVWNYAEAHGKGNVLWPFRMALTGQEKSPDPFTSAGILGREEALKRISLASEKLSRIE